MYTFSNSRNKDKACVKRGQSFYHSLFRLMIDIVAVVSRDCVVASYCQGVPLLFYRRCQVVHNNLKDYEDD